MRRLAMAMAILALAWSGVGWAADDQRVADTLAKNLKASEVLKGFQIKVQYREGTARLEGWVRNKQQLDEAVAIVNRSPEVERVLNQLEIKAGAAPAAQIIPAAGQIVPATAQIVPASASRPQRLPPAPENAKTISPDSSGPASDQPVLRSALRSPRNAAQPAELKPAEFKPVTSGLSPLPPATLPVEGQRVGQRNSQMNGGQMSALRSVASISPAMLPMQSNSAASNATPSNSSMPSAPAEPARPIVPKPMSAAPKPMPMNSNVQRPNVQRATPVQQVDENWGRSAAAAAPQTNQNVPRRPTPMPYSQQQQQMAYQQQYAQAAYAQQQYAQQQYAQQQYQAYAQQQYARGYPQQYQTAAAYPQQPGPMPMGGAGPMPMPVPAQVPGVGGGPAPAMYDQPYMPNYAWPSYAAYPNYAAVSYPKQYSPTAWPYIGPFYPYPQVPLGWRKVTLEWDDGWWFLDFSDDRRHGCGR